MAFLGLAFLSLLGLASGCIYKYGTSPDSLVAPKNGTPWDYAMAGTDWTGVDAAGQPWKCLTGASQTPINLPLPGVLDGTGPRISLNLRTNWTFPVLLSNGSNVNMINTGNAIQVEWTSPFAASVPIAVPATPTATTTLTAVLGMNKTDAHTFVNAVPIQIHFHTSSLHTLVGKYLPLEMHIVHRVTDFLPACAGGCYAITAIVFELQDNDNPLLADMWANLPTREGEVKKLPKGAAIRLHEIIPPIREYATYSGSLDNPPCTEDILWFVIVKTQKISNAQLNKYKQAVGYKECTLKNGTSTLPAGPDDYTCKLAGFSQNFRSMQKRNNRVVKMGKLVG